MGFLDRLRALIEEQFRGRPRACERCGNPASALHYLDPTWRGRFEGTKQYICISCAQEVLKTGLAAVSGHCVLAEPAARGNAYYAYDASDEDVKLASGASGGKDLVEARRALEELQSLIGVSCEDCGAAAAFLWIPAQVFDEKWWDFDLRTLPSRLGDQFRSTCGACAAEAICHAVESKRIRLDDLWQPGPGTVLMFSGEA